MTYGAQLQNELGETITEYEDVLYEIDTFQTITPPTYQYSYGFDRAYFQGWVNTVSSPATPHYEQVARSGHMAVSGWSSDGRKRSRYWVGADMWDLNTLPFVQLKSNGIWGMLGSPFRYANNGARVLQWAVGTSDTLLSCKMASTALPASLSGTYGMQIRKPNGDVSFDSRAKMISLAGHFYMSQSDMNAVLENGATRTYSINSPAPGAYICAPHYTSFLYTGTGAAWVPRLRQTDSTTFLLDRIAISGLRPGPIPAAGYAGAFFHDTTVMVARNI
ncbi:hypothetical protein [Tritonibacter mobilis]|uniref:hypothetical protein n=1 Tax=Tritonibacter mobilis TaxID=379347 RepID=UPI001448A073|nr:hypothetical protein [Rhodobacteraceae bacterium R_SAG3]